MKASENIRQILEVGYNGSDEQSTALSVALDLLEKIENAVDEGYLCDWYINSVNPEDEPVWTEKHIKELVWDFILIPKEKEDESK